MGYLSMVKWKLVTVILVGVIVLSLGSIQLPRVKASPDIIYSDPQDGYVDSDHNVDAVTSIALSGDSQTIYYRAFFKFSLAGISRLTSSASLNIYLHSSRQDSILDSTSPLTNPGLFDCVVAHIADYGTLNDGDFYASTIGNNPGTILSLAATPDIGYVSIDVTDAVNQDLIEGRAWSAFMLRQSINTDSDVYADFWKFLTVEYTGTSQDPYIEYVTGSPQIGDVAPAVFHESPNIVSFIYADPSRMLSETSHWTEGYAAYDATAAGFLYGLCDNKQTILFDNDTSVVVPKPETNYGEVLLDNKCVVAVGGPIPNWVVDYYERTMQSPVKYNYNPTNPGFDLQDETPLHSIPSSIDRNHHDIFVIEAFTDSRGNFVVIIYGTAWKGTFAGGIYFKDVISNNLASYTGDVYIFEWIDAGAKDGVPQTGEIIQFYPTP